MTKVDIEFTGERFVPGKAKKHADDHHERYIFAGNYCSGKKILDIACGTGYGAPMLQQAGALTYQGVDIDKDAVAYATAHYGNEKIIYSCDDIRSFGNHESYDLITCFETIEHITFYSEALVNLFRVLKPGGQLIISSPNRPVSAPCTTHLSDTPPNLFHTQEFTPEELIQELVSAGFVLNDKTVYGQRQRVHFKSKFMRKLAKKLLGNPNKKTTAKVEPVINKSPRYFVLVASKPDC